MWEALGSIWKAVMAIMIGAEKLGNAFTNIAQVAENASADFRDAEALKAKAKHEELIKELKI